jgi:hypothetical protein
MKTQVLSLERLLILCLLSFSGITAVSQTMNSGYDSLYINNVNALFNASGIHFFFEKARYEVPKGSGKTSIFSNSLWIGGMDASDQLHFAGERYRQGPGVSNPMTKPDYYVGPVMDSAGYSPYQDSVWNYIWNLTSAEIEYHKTHYTNSGYTPIHDILTWPGNGNTSLGQAQLLAPFFDRNGDQIYDPYDGDYPLIRGDQALFFIFNDDRGEHLESTGAKLRIEIHGMAYAFELSGDSALNNTVFLNYQIYNRSLNTYNNALFGIFTDIDLGYPNDDFIGCDVERNMYFGYNGTPVDGNGQPEAYGANPPVQSVTLLAGPYMDPDGIDNPRYDQQGHQLCDYSVNGVNFGDSIIDNERYGLQRFFYINNSNSGVPAYMTDPAYAPDYYQLMNGQWKDSSFLIYGGNGHAQAGGYGPECRFMFPGLSDSLNWGTGCTPPNGPRDWTETTAGNNPNDRRGVGITGPVTFHPGDVQDLDIAFSWAREYQSGIVQGSLEKLRVMTDEINTIFATNKLPNGNTFFGINDNAGLSQMVVNIYPNPSSDYINVSVSGNFHAATATFDLMTGQGNSIKSMRTTGSEKILHLDVSEIPAGFYFIRVMTNQASIVKKVVIIH